MKEIEKFPNLVETSQAEDAEQATAEFAGSAENASELMNRRDFFRKFAPKKEQQKDVDVEIAEIRDNLHTNPDELDSNLNPNHVSEAPAELKSSKQGRRKFLTTLAAFTGSAVLFFKFDKLQQWVHQYERKEYPKHLAGTIEGIKDLYANMDQEADSEVWARSIERAFQQSNIPNTEENMGLVLTLIAAESGFRAIPRVYDYSPAIMESFLDEVGQPPRTGGPMELGYAHVQNRERITYEEAVAVVNTIDGGLRHSFILLQEIIQAYENVASEVERLQLVFADWNAGLHHSRNAGLQSEINKLTGQQLKLDGILGEATVKTITDLFARKGISTEHIAKDIARSKSNNFNTTPTWRAIERLAGKPIEPVVADVPVLGFYGTLKKVTTGVGTSKEFAEARLREYEEIREVMRKFE